MSAAHARAAAGTIRSAGAIAWCLAAGLTLAGCERSGDDPGASADGATVLPTLAETAGVHERQEPVPKQADDETVRIDRIDPCMLLTPEEAGAIVGTRLRDAHPANVGSERPSCTYSDQAGPTAQVQVYLGSGAESLIATHRRLGGELIDVEELGEDAFLRHATLHFHASGIAVAVSVVRLVDVETLHPAMIAAAHTIAGRMASPSAVALPASTANGHDASPVR